MAYAMTRYFFASRLEVGDEAQSNDFSQAAYMREVRLRNAEQIAACNGYGRQHMVVSAAFYALLKMSGNPRLIFACTIGGTNEGGCLLGKCISTRVTTAFILAGL